MRLAAHILAPVMLPAAVLLGVAALSLAPRGGLDAAHLVTIEDDPVALADYAVAKTLTPEVARREIENALAADDADLAASFLALARASATSPSIRRSPPRSRRPAHRPPAPSARRGASCTAS